MGILDRLSTLISSNLNSAIDKMTDPGKEVEQLILDMETQVRRARDEVRTTMANEKRQRQRVEKLVETEREWEERAERAVRAGDDGLAKSALERRGELAAERAEAEKGLREQAAYVDQLTSALKQLEARVEEVKGKKETLKARARANKGQSTVGSGAFNEFDRLSGKVDAVEAEAALDDELAAVRHEDAKSREVERKLADLEKNTDVEDRLAALKAKMQKKEE